MLFLDQLKANPNALVTINPGDPTYIMQGFITEDFAFGGANTFNSAMEAILGSRLDNAKATANKAFALRSLGQSTAGHPIAARVINGGDSLSSWIASDRPAFTLNLLFLAANQNDNPIVEAQKLLRYVYPDGNTGIGTLTAPLGYAPSLSNNAQGGMTGASAITIGQWFATPPLFLAKSVQLTIAQRTDPNGVPLYVQASVAFEAARIMTYDEVQGLFSGVGGSFGPGSSPALVGSGIASSLFKVGGAALSAVFGGL